MSSILPLNPSGNVLSGNDAHLPAGSGSVPGVCLSGFEPTTLPPPYLLPPDRHAARECGRYGWRAAGDNAAAGRSPFMRQRSVGWNQSMERAPKGGRTGQRIRAVARILVIVW